MSTTLQLLCLSLSAVPPSLSALSVRFNQHFYTPAHTKHSLFLAFFYTKKSSFLSLLHLRLFFIINVNVLHNRKKTYTVRTSKMTSSQVDTLLPLLDLFHLGSVLLACIHSYSHAILVITPLHSKTLSSICSDRCLRLQTNSPTSTDGPTV